MIVSIVTVLSVVRELVSTVGVIEKVCEGNDIEECVTSVAVVPSLFFILIVEIGQLASFELKVADYEGYGKV